MGAKEVQEGGSLQAAQSFQGPAAQQEVADQHCSEVGKPRQ